MPQVLQVAQDDLYALRRGDLPPEEFAVLAGVFEEAFDSLTAQVDTLARRRTGYTALIDEMLVATRERRDGLAPAEDGNAAQRSRYENTLKVIDADLLAVEAAQAAFAQPVDISPWLERRFAERWEMTVKGEFARQELQTQSSELLAQGLGILVERSARNPYTSITEALKLTGFQRMRPGSGQLGEHPTFGIGDFRIAMRRGGVQLTETGLVPVEQEGMVSIEAIATERAGSRISDLRACLETVMAAADDLEVSLCVNPFPIDLGELKPLDGVQVKAFFEGYGFTVGEGGAMTRMPAPSNSLERLLGDAPAPCSDQELEELGDLYRACLQNQQEDGWQMHHLFDDPKEVVRIEHKVRAQTENHGLLTPEAARARVKEWADHAAAQGKTGVNGDKVVLSFFDKTGAWSKPWRDAGYNVFQFDIQSGDGVETLGINTGDVTNFDLDFFNDIFASFDGMDIYCVLSATPCTDFANSGSRHFEGKDAAGTTAFSVQLARVALAAIEYFKPSIWSMENPSGRIERLVGLPPWTVSFDPCHFGEDYTKKTLLWGRMNGDMPVAPCEPTEGSKMHRLYGGKSLATKNARSQTPEGFSYAFFMANNMIDNPVLAASCKYDRLDASLIESAVNAGMTLKEMDHVLEDDYYDVNDQAATEALQAAVQERLVAGPSEESVLAGTVQLLTQSVPDIARAALGAMESGDQAELQRFEAQVGIAAQAFYAHHQAGDHEQLGLLLEQRLGAIAVQMGKGDPSSANFGDSQDYEEGEFEAAEFESPGAF